MITASTADWQRLRGMVKGPLLRPGDPGFRSGSEPFNKRHSTLRPAGVVSVVDAEDIRQAIRWARDSKVPVVPRGGGHSYAGYSVNDGLVLDLRRLEEVHADPSTGLVTIGGGARMARIYDAIQPSELAFPLGNSPAVGIGGLVLGGGVAATSRKFGLTCDALVATTVVTAEGDLVTCNETENADLFWACRGGGGGNFGVNVSFTFQAHPVVASATCLLLWNWSDAPEVLAVFQELVRQAPDEFSVRLGVSKATGGNGIVSAVGQFLGPATELRALLDPVLAVAQPVRQDIADRTYWAAKDYLLHTTSGDPFAVRTRCAGGPLPEQGVAAMLAWIDRWPGSSNPDGGGVAMFSWGGAMNRVSADATAFPHRDMLFLLSMDTSWGADDPPEVVEANLRWLAGLHAEMSRYTSDSAYLNFTDPDLADWRRAYYGTNYPRLIAVKRKYDPDQVFQFDQAIPA